MTDNTIKTKLVWDVSQASSAAESMTGHVAHLQTAMNRIQATVAAVGVGLTASFAGGALRSAVGSAMEFHNQLEQGQMKLSMMLVSADNMDFQTARTASRALFAQIQGDADAAYGEAQDLLNVFSSIVVPGRQLGKTNEELRDLTRSAANFAGANSLMVDQVGRDMQEILTGKANNGANNTFKMMRMHMQNISAEEFNRLDAAERYQRVQETLTKLGGGEFAEAIGQSFDAQLSSVTGKLKTLRETMLGGPLASILASTLGKISTALANPKLIAFATAVGALATRVLTPFATKVAQALTWVGDHWQEVMQKGLIMAAHLKRAGEIMLRAAAAMAVVRAAQGVAGVAGAIAPTGGAVAAGVVGMFGALKAGLIGLGTPIGWLLYYLTEPRKAIIALGTGLRSLTVATWSTLAPLLPFIAIFLALAGVIYIAMSHAQTFMPVLNVIWQLFLQMIGAAVAFGRALWSFLEPIITFFGGVLLAIALPAIMLAISALTNLFKFFTNIFTWLGQALGGFSTWVHGMVDRLLSWLRSFGLNLGGSGLGNDAATGQGWMDRFMAQMNEAMAGITAGGATPATPGGGVVPQTHNDMRGAKITVKQEFKDADPDRVMGQMIDDINRQATMRIQSGYVPPMG